MPVSDDHDPTCSGEQAAFLPARDLLGLLAYGRADGFMQHDEGSDQKWWEAATHLCNAIAAGRLHAWGRRGTYWNNTEADALPRPIPPGDVHPDWTTMQLDTTFPHDPIVWLTLRPDAGYAESQKTGWPQWARVEFPRDEAEAWLEARQPAAAVASHTPPTGTMFIDTAFDQIVERLRLPAGPATTQLRDALRAGNIRTWMKRATSLHDHESFIQLETDLETIELNVIAFRNSDPQGIRCGFRYRNHPKTLRNFVIAADDFEHWLHEKLSPDVADEELATGAAATNPRPKPTAQALQAWVRERVRDWPDHLPPPSEAEDWTAARQHFGDLMTRDNFRQTRQELTPHEWQRQGPRKPWGKLKA